MSASKLDMYYMPYITIGDPSLSLSIDFALALIDSGADVLELGIPFSDPIADGPIIQAAMDRALKNDLSIEKIFTCCQEIHRQRPNVPLYFLSYFNVIINAFQFLEPCQNKDNYERQIQENLSLFLKECQKSGVRGLVIPDLPFDQIESSILQKLTKKYGVCQIFMLTPNTQEKRRQKILSLAKEQELSMKEFYSTKDKTKNIFSWLYYVSSLGVTGIRSQLPDDLLEKLTKIKKESDIPLFAGFGFHQAEQVLALKNKLDGIIVGSKNQSLIAEHKEKATEELKKLCTSFVKACHG